MWLQRMEDRVNIKWDLLITSWKNIFLISLISNFQVNPTNQHEDDLDSLIDTSIASDENSFKAKEKVSWK